MDPIAAIVLTLVLLFLFIASLIVVSQLARRRKKAKRQAFADAAAARGWAYEARGSGLVYAFTAKPFRRGAKRKPDALDVVSGSLSGRGALAFHYRYSRGTNPDNLSEVYSWFTVCAVQLPDELSSVPAERKSFTVDRGNALVKLVMRRRLTWCVDGNWLMCWERGVASPIEELFVRLDVLAAIVDGRVGGIQVA